MSNRWLADHMTIAHLRIKARAADPQADQAQVMRLVSGTEWQPAGLTPAAILCVRHLRVLVPTELLHQSSTAYSLVKWEQPIAAILDPLAHTAIRPIQTTPPANANAILFADRSELLACLASDWLSGMVTTRWWWQSFCNQGDVTRAVLAAWLDGPEYVPSALTHLATRRQAVTFVARLPVHFCQTLLTRLVHCFGLTALQPILATGQATLDQDERTVGIAENRTVDQPAPAHALLAAPWQRWAPEADRDQLGAAQQLLLGISLLVQRAPTVVRTGAFAAAVQQWRQKQPPLPEGTSGVAPYQQAVRQAADVHTNATPATRPVGDGCQAAAVTASAAPLAPPHDQGDAYTEQSSLLTNSIADRPVRQARPAEFNAAPQASANALSLVDPATLAFPTRNTALAPVTTTAGAAQLLATDWLPDSVPATVTHTAYGGLFYLINLGLYLGLYADFTTPLTPGIDLNIYDFVALVGEQLVGEALRADPVWPLLAALAGRSVEEPPGATFAPPTGEALATWLATQMSVICPRLLQALALQEDPALLPTLLCVHAARVVVSATHLDLFFALATLPIQLRLSGLDRNPGWVPAAGRYVTFYFE